MIQTNSRFHSHIKRAVIFVGLTITAALITGCSSGAVVDTLATSPTSSQRRASDKGTRLCIINNSSMNVKVLWRGFPDERAIEPGGQNCNSGYEIYKNGDVLGTIKYEPTAYPGNWLSLKFFGEHDWAFGARVGVAYSAQGKMYGFCGGMDIGQKGSMQVDWLRAEALRLDDSDENAELELSLTDSSGQNYSKRINNCSFEE